MCKLERDPTNNPTLTKALSGTENTKDSPELHEWWIKELTNPQEALSLHTEIREGRFTSAFLWSNPQMKINWKPSGTTNRTMLLWGQELVSPFVLCTSAWCTSAAVHTRRNNLIFIPYIHLRHILEFKQLIGLFFLSWSTSLLPLWKSLHLGTLHRQVSLRLAADIPVSNVLWLCSCSFHIPWLGVLEQTDVVWGMFVGVGCFEAIIQNIHDRASERVVQICTANLFLRCMLIQVTNSEVYDVTYVSCCACLYCRSLMLSKYLKLFAETTWHIVLKNK